MSDEVIRVVIEGGKVLLEEGPINWTLIATLILTVITAGGALAAALAAWRNTDAARKNTEIANMMRKQQLIGDLLDYRYQKDRFDAMWELRQCYDRHGEDALAERFNEIRDTPEGRKLDWQRKIFTTYFRKIKDVQEAGLIKEPEIIGLVNKSDLTMFLHIVRPMSEQIDLFEIDPIDPGEKKAKENIFDYFERFYWKHRKELKGESEG